MDESEKGSGEPKRAKRDRKQVTLLSNEYSTIYAEENNRKMDATKKSKTPKATTKPTKKRSYSKDEEDEEVELSENTTYQWVGEGRVNSDENRLYFDKLEMKVGDHPALIQTGDNILLSSGDTSAEDVFDKATVTRSIMGGGDQDLNDRANVAMNKLKPFVGKVKAMWEEDAVDSKDKKSTTTNVVRHDDDRRNRMKVLVQWYYKKDDVAGLRGTFDGISKQTILNHLHPRDLLLGEIEDENEISTILGKCHVSRCAPDMTMDLKDSSHTSSSESLKRSRGGSFTCNFDISISTNKGKNKVTIVPYQGVPIQSEEPAPKRPRTTSLSESDILETADNTVAESQSIEDANDDVSGDGDSSSESSDILSKKPSPESEGNANQKIMVGPAHQATLPPFTPRQRSQAEHAPPVPIWIPDKINDVDLDEYLDSAKDILMQYMKDKKIEITRIVPHNLEEAHLQSKFTVREFNVDQIFKVLHDKSYDKENALKAMKTSPHLYLNVWTKEEKELYDAGFKRHFSAIRVIANGMSSFKKHKDVVDYHYRFKIPDQFRRYEDKKREQAMRMLQAIEKQRMKEYISTETAQSVTNSVGKTNQSWLENGGGETNVIGNAEARRLEAKDFLASVKETIGPSEYLKLVDHLKGLHSQVITVPECRKAFQDQLKGYPDLMKSFDKFLPQRFTN